MSDSFGAFNQGSWQGVGDWDECWIIATYWALVVTGAVRRKDLPSIKAFRAAAGRPDLPGPSGGANKDLLKALNKLVPGAEAKNFIGTLTGLTKQLKHGYVASLSVLSGALPKYLQFGFKGSHQVSVYMQGGKYYVMNPLAKEGSALIEISARDLAHAGSRLFSDHKLHAVLIKAKALEAAKPSKPVKPPPAPHQPRTLEHHVPRRDYIEPYAASKFLEARPGGVRIEDPSKFR